MRTNRNDPPLRLKHASGWFAAGREVAEALTLLSDAAFKLFLWLCLHADRSRGATDEKNPTSRLLLQILASVAEFEREMIRERTLSGIRAAQAAGKVVGRPKRVFRRDEVVRLRDVEGLSWRAIGKKLGIPAMTALDSYRQSGCTETVVPEAPVSSGKRTKKTVAA